MKRVSESQLTKDNADAFDENDHPGRESEGFDRAPPEVMATRRIVKVRRTLSSTPPAPNASNPFAKQTPGSDNSQTDGGTGVPSAHESPAKQVNPFAALAASADKPSSAKKLKTSIEAPVTDDKPESNALGQPEQHDHAVPSVREASNSVIVAAEKRTEIIVSENPDSGDTESGISVAVSKSKSEEKVDSAKNDNLRSAPGTDNDAQNGENVPKLESSPSNGEIKNEHKNTSEMGNDSKDPTANDGAKESNSGGPSSAAEPEVNKPNVESSGAETPAKVVNTPQDDRDGAGKGKDASADVKKSGFGIFSGGVTFGSLDKSTPLLTFASAAKGDGEKLSFTATAGLTSSDAGKVTEVTVEQKEFKEEKIETGEEDEIELFRSRAKLYCLEQGESGAHWKERGVGQLKLKVNNDKGRARLIMRTEATLRVILNCAIYDNTKLEKASDRSVRFSGIETTDEHAEKGRCFLARFSTKEVTGTFITAVEKCKEDLPDRANNE